MIQTLIFFLVVLFSLVCGLVILTALIRRRKRTAWLVLRTLLLVYGAYAVTLVGVGLASKPEEIGIGQEKCFDDWCVAVVHWEKGPIGDSTSGATPYYIVTLEVSNEAKRADMTPDHPRVALLDDQGHSHGISVEGQQVYERFNGVQPPIGRFVAAGESFATTVVFDVPPGSTHPTFYVAEGSWPTQWLISDENSYFHAKRVTPLY